MSQNKVDSKLQRLIEKVYEKRVKVIIVREHTDERTYSVYIKEYFSNKYRFVGFEKIPQDKFYDNWEPYSLVVARALKKFYVEPWDYCEYQSNKRDMKSLEICFRNKKLKDIKESYLLDYNSKMTSNAEVIEQWALNYVDLEILDWGCSCCD